MAALQKYKYFDEDPMVIVAIIDDLSCVHRQFSCLGTDLSHFLH
jgi:hypothetical protein